MKKKKKRSSARRLRTQIKFAMRAAIFSYCYSHFDFGYELFSSCCKPNATANWPHTPQERKERSCHPPPANHLLLSLAFDSSHHPPTSFSHSYIKRAILVDPAHSIWRCLQPKHQWLLLLLLLLKQQPPLLQQQPLRHKGRAHNSGSLLIAYSTPPPP